MKRRRFELLSEPQNGDLTSVVLLKVGVGPCHRGVPLHTLGFFFCIFLTVLPLA